MPIKVLIADDEENVRELLRETLGDERYQFLFATDGEQALNLARTEQPDLMFLDIVMPKRYGWDVCKLLKTDGTTAHIRIVMMSALIQESHRRKAMQIGADAYLAKPFSPAEVVQVAEGLLGLSPARS